MFHPVRNAISNGASRMKRKLKKKRDIRKKVIRLTKGLVSALEDFILMQLAIMDEISLHPIESLTQRIEHMEMRLEGYDPDKLYKGFYRAREKGWLDPDWKLTKEGWKRLKSVLPQYKKPLEWNGKWYIITFDIPESAKRKRDAFREKLKKLGFGKLQASVWISPMNWLANVESLVKFHKMEYWVIPSVTDKLGRETSEELTERVWPVGRINLRYKNFISRCKRFFRKEGYKISKSGLQMEYLNILKEDPQLPRDLLPGDWQGRKAQKFYLKLLTKVPTRVGSKVE